MRYLADIATDTSGPEWVAALYESYAADLEALEHPTSDRVFYARAADRTCEALDLTKAE